MKNVVIVRTVSDNENADRIHTHTHTSTKMYALGFDETVSIISRSFCFTQIQMRSEIVANTHATQFCLSFR